MGDVSHGVGRLGERCRKPSRGRVGFEREAFGGIYPSFYNKVGKYVKL